MTKKSNSWNLQELQETLVKDTEQSIEQGFESIRNGESLVNSAQPPAEQREQKKAEPTKGVQTYITTDGNQAKAGCCRETKTAAAYNHRHTG